MKHDPIPVREIRKTGKNNQLSLYLTDWAQAVDKVDFSNRLCHTAFYIPHREPKKELF